MSAEDLLLWLPYLLHHAEQGLPVPGDLPLPVRQAAQHLNAALCRVRDASRHDTLLGVQRLTHAIRHQGRHIAHAQQHVEKLPDDQGPDILKPLYAADHANAVAARLTTRLSILSGLWPPARRSPAPLVDVIRAAAQGVDDYKRARIGSDLHVLVHPEAVEPLVAALAELIDNALHHSHTPVHVEALYQVDTGGVCVTVTDFGTGMQPVTADTARQVLKYPGSVPPSLWSGQGLRLVAAVARALAVEADLASSPESGTRASVLLPPALFSLPN